MRIIWQTFLSWSIVHFIQQTNRKGIHTRTIHVGTAQIHDPTKSYFTPALGSRLHLIGLRIKYRKVVSTVKAQIAQ